MKRVLTCLVACLLMAGCKSDAVSQKSHTETSSRGLSAEEAYIQSQEALYGDSYTPKYEAKFGPYTEERDAEIKSDIPVINSISTELKEIISSYFPISPTERLVGNPSQWENSDWIRNFGREYVSIFGNTVNLGLVLTIIELENIDSKCSDNTFFKARVEKSFSCNLKPGDEIIIRQDGTMKSGVYTGPVSFNYKLFQPGQKITVLSFKTKIELKDGSFVEAYCTMFDKVLYNVTINGDEYVLDLMNWNVVEAAYFFKKASGEADAYKYFYGKNTYFNGSSNQDIYIGVLKPEVVDGILTELL